MNLSVLFLVLSLQISVAGEAPKTCSEWVSEGTALVDDGDYRAATHAFRQALTAGEKAGLSDRLLARIIGSLASAYADAGRYLDAEREWRRALALIKHTDGVDSLNYALLVASIAVLPTETGNREQTITMIRGAIARNARSGYRDLAVLRGSLAQLLIERKSYIEAEAVLLDLQADFARLDKSSRRQLADLLNYLGGMRYEQGQVAESVEAFREELSVLEYDVGTEHATLVVPLNNLATSLAKLGRIEEAGMTFQRATTLCGKTLGGDHPTCGALLGNYSVVLRKLGREHEAKAMTEQARQTRQASDRRNGLGAVVSFENLKGREQ